MIVGGGLIRNGAVAPKATKGSRNNRYQYTKEKEAISTNGDESTSVHPVSKIIEKSYYEQVVAEKGNRTQEVFTFFYNYFYALHTLPLECQFWLEANSACGSNLVS